jgi:hypothetical protein
LTISSNPQAEKVLPLACQTPKTRATLFSRQGIHPVQEQSLSLLPAVSTGTPLVMGEALRAKTLL